MNIQPNKKGWTCYISHHELGAMEMGIAQFLKRAKGYEKLICERFLADLRFLRKHYGHKNPLEVERYFPPPKVKHWRKKQ